MFFDGDLHTFLDDDTELSDELEEVPTARLVENSRSKAFRIQFTPNPAGPRKLEFEVEKRFPASKTYRV